MPLIPADIFRFNNNSIHIVFVGVAVAGFSGVAFSRIFLGFVSRLISSNGWASIFLLAAIFSVSLAFWFLYAVSS